MNYFQKLQKYIKHVESTIQDFGISQVAQELLDLAEQRKELAKIATDNQYEDNWTHGQLMQFLETGEF
jgi:hypothetical protein